MKQNDNEQIISHIYKDRNGRWIIQSNEQHSAGVARLASQFAGEFEMAEWGKVLGLLHDKGKESTAFQQYIKKESGYEPDIKISGRHNHAYIGGILARKYYGMTSDNFFVNQIISHHTGLHDSDEIKGIVDQEIPSEINIYHIKEKLNRPALNIQKNDFHHLARMLFSCLVDADFLDTESFMDKESSALRQNKDTLKDLLPLLENKLKDLKTKANSSEINIIRNQIQQQCIKMADTPIGFFSLTVPTGGGKTLSSLVWAIKHAIHNGQKRIIIAIPYTSIIVQTASVLRSIFGDENVLEHHSCVNPEQIKDEKLKEKMKLATENWDYPIIVTTNVQLFESMFSNKPSVCRKLHNIVNSVVILDEVQTLSMDFLQPIVDSLKTYNKLFNVSFQVAKDLSDGYDIFIKEKAVLNSEIDKAHDDEEVKKAKDKTAAARLFMCKNYYDIRTFGAVMSTGKNAGQVRGPIQFTFARSVDPIATAEHSITRMAVATENEAEKQKGDNRTMGRKATVPYGLYVCHGFISANLAKQTGFSEEDLQLFFEALKNMFDVDRSAARGLMSAQKLIVFRHDSILGNAPANKLFDLVKIKKNTDAAPRSFNDYDVTIDKDSVPNSVAVEELI